MECVCCSSLIAIFVLLISAFLWIYYRSSKSISSGKGLHVFITGGSSGIGLELAKQFHAAGASCVTIAARNEDLLRQAVDEIKTSSPAGGAVLYVPMNVTDSEDIVNGILSQHMQTHGPINVLVNCAGVAVARTFVDTSLEVFERLMRLNFIGTVNVTKPVVKSMLQLKAKDPTAFTQICCVSSVAGQLGVYGYTAYSASKFALRGFAETLAMELRPMNIGVTLAFPPDTNTPGYKAENEGKPEICQKISELSNLCEPSMVAKSIHNDILSKQFFSSVGLDGWLVTNVTSGFSWPSSPLHILQQFFLLGPLRLVSYGYLLYMNHIVTSSTRK